MKNIESVDDDDDDDESDAVYEDNRDDGDSHRGDV